MGRSDRTKPNDDHGDLRWQMRSHHRRKRSSSRGESVLVVVRARGRARRWKYINTSRVILSLWVVFLVFFSLAVRLVRSGQRGKNKTLLGIAASCRLPPPRWRLRLTLQEILRSKRRKKNTQILWCFPESKNKRERSCDWKMCYFWCSQAHQINLQSLKSVCFVEGQKESPCGY